MRGIAVIDRQPGAMQMAVWVTSRAGVQAQHVNAVVIEVEGDPEAVGKLRSLTRCCAVLVTDSTTLDGLPIEGQPLTLTDIDLLLDEVETQQARILDAIADYKRHSRSKALIEPTFPARLLQGDFVPSENTASQRAFAAANFLRAAWAGWLNTDEERRRRTEQPRTGKTPWIMPDGMNSAGVADFPEQFAARLHEQPLV